MQSNDDRQTADSRWWGTWSRLPILLLLTTLGLWLGGCGSEDPGKLNTGRVDAQLVTTAASGTSYRLESVTLTIDGPTPTTLVGDDTDPDETILAAELDAGAYTAILEPGWTLVRLDEEGPVPEEATLLSPNPAAFTITSGAVTSLTLTFQTSGGVIQFAPGTLEVDIDVVTTTPSLPVLASSAPSLPGAPLDLAAGPGLAYVLTSTSLVGLEPGGSMVFNAVLPSGTGRTVLADGDDAVVVTTEGTTARLLRYDATGNLIGSVPFNTGFFSPQSEVCATRSPSGLIVVATHENGPEVRVRAFDGPNLHWMSVLNGPFAQPLRCDLFVKQNDITVFGARTGSQSIQVNRIFPDGISGGTTTLGAGVTDRFQIADDGSPEGFLAAWGGPGSAQLVRVDGGSLSMLQVLAGSTNTVRELLSGSFFGQPGLTAVLAGQVGGEGFLGAFTVEGEPVSENRDGGSEIIAADAGHGLLWTLATGPTERLLTAYPQ